jgi:MFS family permease
LVLVSAVVLVDTAFYAAIVPLLPEYADDLDLSKSAAGVLTASYAAGTLVGSIPGGWLAARLGVKPTLLTGLGLLAGTSVAFGLAQDIVVLDTVRFVQGVGGACSWAAGMAWLVGMAPPDRRGELIGSALAAAIVGVMLGPVLGGAATVVGPEVVFPAVAVIATGLAAWAWTVPGIEPARGPVMRPLVAGLKHPAVLSGLWLFCVPAVFAGVIGVLAPLRLDDLGASGVAVGAVFLVMAGVEAAISPFAGRVSDRRGRLAPIRAGLVGAIVAAVVLPLPGTATLLALALVGAVAALGMFWAPGMALLSDASETAGMEQGLAFAIANLAWAGGQLLGGAGAGALADASSDALAYGLMGLLCALTLVALMKTSDVRRPASGAARPG